MQIFSAAKQLPAALSLDRFKSGATDAAPSTDDVDAAQNDLATRAVGANFHEILSKYDVTNITPAEFSNLTQELHDAGEISDAEFRDMAKIRVELEQSGAAADEPVNLVSFFEDKLAEQQQNLEQIKANGPASVTNKLDDGRFLADAKQQLDWVRKFALVHESGAAGVDVGA